MSGGNRGDRLRALGRPEMDHHGYRLNGADAGADHAD